MWHKVGSAVPQIVAQAPNDPATLPVVGANVVAGTLSAQDPTGSTGLAPSQGQQGQGQGAGVTLAINAGSGGKQLGSALEIVLLMTLLAMAPAIVMTMTCFTRIVVVLSFLKRAMSMQDLPPAMITTVAPRAKMPSSEALRAMSRRLSSGRNQ